MKLTRATIDTIQLPPGRRDMIVFDDTLPGFGLRIRAGGSRKWIVQYEAHGQQRRVTIGSTAIFDPDKAKKAARELLARVRLGQDPQANKIEEGEQSKLTLGAIIDRYLVERGSKLRPTSLRNTRRYLLQHWKPLHRMPIHKIERRNIAALLGGDAPVAAARARSTLSALFVWAIQEGLTDTNPTIGTRRPDEGAKPRERVLKDEELAAIWRACDDAYDYGRIVKLLFLCAARRQEVGGMCWSELDHESGTWTIPGERTKNRRMHVLPLPALAWSIIDTVPHRGDHLFGRSGFANWGEAKAALDRRLNLPAWTLHDIRRTVATGMNEIGIQPHIVEAVLNHATFRKGSAAPYNWARYEREMRTALALWADHVWSLVDGSERKIIPLQPRS
jgi:integrase